MRAVIQRVTSARVLVKDPDGSWRQTGSVGRGLCALIGVADDDTEADAQAMADKIRVAVESRSDPNFLIIARTDARTTHGLDEALRRAEIYARAGADLLFVESPESIEEMERIGKAFDLPLVANMVEGGRTPVLSREDLQAIGYRLAIFPAAAFLAAGAAFESVYKGIQATGSTVGTSTPLYDFGKFSQMMGFDWVAQFDSEHKQD
jgi:2-methylisocitrate lyase-like PEP mutase family enzyme